MGVCHSKSEPKGPYNRLGETFKAQVRPIHSGAPVTPVRQGLCVSGGGARAFSWALGVYRGLGRLKLEPEAISSVSGGTWCSAVFVFAHGFQGCAMSTSQLLGAATAPAELTLEALEVMVPAASGLVRGDANEILRQLMEECKGKEYEIWPRFMARWLLRDFDGLASFESYMARAEDVKRIKDENPQLEKKPFLSPLGDKPSTFIMNGCTLAPLNYRAEQENVVSLQMSADFTGCPFYPEDQQVTYRAAKSQSFDCHRCRLPKVLTVGGGLVESFAFGGAAPRDQGGGERCAVGEPLQPFALPYAVGISSWAVGGALNQVKEYGNMLNIRQDYWPVTSDILPAPQEAMSFQFGDGGSLENAGLLPLLQRGARKVVWVAASFQALNAAYDWDSATVETFDPVAAGVIDQVYVTFGYRSPYKTCFYDHNQVFSQHLCLPFCQQIRALKEAGKPVVLRQKLPVLPNTWWGIQGGYDLELVLVYLETCRDFEAQLPLETRKEIAKGDRGAFAHYPIYATTGQNEGDVCGLTQSQVNLLAAQAEYSVMRNAEIFREVLATAV